ncbi:MAG: hypothetical protein E4H09_01485 [Spirochaetales bacterium]|nr:MAG: hypothetical protein E4H09_01485 [Spirochaetales bacterium]
MIPLDGTWNLTYLPSPRDIPDTTAHRVPQGDMVRAEVPGNVELDLERAGILPELYLGDNILRLRALEYHEWWYQREFPSPVRRDDQSVELVFGGVDCIATYWLNGILLGETSNAFIEHRFDVTSLLAASGDNSLTVRIASPLLAAARRSYEPLMHAQRLNWAQLGIRKPAHAYGWDIMPRAVTAGLWRSVSLVVHEAVEISELLFTTRSTGELGGDGKAGPAVVELFYALRADPRDLEGAKLRVRGSCGDSAFDTSVQVDFIAGKVRFEIQDPHLWWPVGYGEPELYRVTVSVMRGDRVIAEQETAVGVRTIELDRTETTTIGNPGNFLFRVNGTPILCNGSNWVPADVFHSRDAARYDALLDLVKDLGCNMIRCWGGGVYEDHAFFDFCDANGIMVWQDFAMACGIYPQDQAFQDAIREEATSVVGKLRGHACLAVWCGDNECDDSWERPSENRLTRNVLPDVVRRLDPGRAYVASSPYWTDAGKRSGDSSSLTICGPDPTIRSG